MRSIFTICFLIHTCLGQAQFLDTLREVVKRKYSIDARLESRNSFIDNSLTTVSGARLGLAFQQKLRFGLGVNWLKSDISRSNTRVLPEMTKENTTLYLKWAYVCAYVDFVFYKTKRWQLSVPIQIGLGQCWWQNNKNYHFNTKEAKYFVFTYEPGITVQFKIFKFFGLGSDVAYRFCLKNNNQVNAKLTCPTYSFKILFWGDQLFYELFPKNRITKRFGPADW